MPTDRLLPVEAAAGLWVDSVVASLDTRGLAAQLVFPWMWGRYVPADSDEARRLQAWVAAGVGGIITSIGPPVALADKLNRLQRQADIPLLIAADLENGPGMRIRGGTLLPYGLDMGGGTVFPPAMGIGATDDPSLAYEMGRITAREARAVGIHLVFAPVVDVNNNPANPIINTRSYGGDPAAVAAFATAQIAGLQEHGVLATAKHFPGHGDVEDDTHLVPLILRIDAERADSVELVPYRAAIRADVAGVMSAHIAFPALAGDSTVPATLSARMLDSLLVREMGFDGLVVTDALDMGAIVQRFGAGDAAVRALEAGADILLQPTDPFLMIEAVAAAVDSGRISRARLVRSARKILEAKARVGLHRQRTVDIGRVADVVGAPGHAEAATRAAERSVTLVRDRDGLVPLVPLRHRRVLVVSYTDVLDPFAGRGLARALEAELPAVERAVLGPERPPASVLDSLVSRAESADLVIFAVDARARGRAGALDSATTAAIRAVAAARPSILVSLGNPYLVSELPEIGTYLLGWSGADVSQAAVGRALVGRSPIVGSLPIAIPPDHGRGEGLGRPAIPYPPVAVESRIPTGQPGSMRPEALDSLAAAVEAAIADGVTPGAAVVVGTSRGAWVGGFGRTDHRPDAPPVTDSTLYDLASLTKVVATTGAVMRLVEQRRMTLDAPISRYLPDWPGGWWDRVTVQRLLIHRAGLPPFIRFWHPSEGGLRGDSAILGAIAALEPAYPPDTEYRYSDLGFILLGAAVEAVTGTSLAAYLDAELWTPLGMHDTGFNPTGPTWVAPHRGEQIRDTVGGLDPAVDSMPVRDPAMASLPAPDSAALRFDLARIAPTEIDTILRGVHVHGQVHDENAWAMGGVAGHAGLFSCAADLARFAHTLLRAGRAGETRVLSPSVVARFTTRHPGTGRALGWDAVDSIAPESADSGPRRGIDAPFSPSAFGHTGFTGTSLWVDPARDLYVILLTNRVNPTREQGGIGALRRAVHEWAVRAVAERAPAGGPG
ncbi:MAG: glycoside hydrolase family 3 N-terminal domain-containing protein [Longimicrobiales bacterium]|nr:glycoside hydrolase family 3 N-terminal domain-containing protein [Longimicrobiales bacterium]